MTTISSALARPPHCLLWPPSPGPKQTVSAASKTGRRAAARCSWRLSRDVGAASAVPREAPFWEEAREDGCQGPATGRQPGTPGSAPTWQLSGTGRGCTWLTRRSPQACRCGSWSPGGACRPSRSSTVRSTSRRSTASRPPWTPWSPATSWCVGPRARHGLPTWGRLLAPGAWGRVDADAWAPGPKLPL